MGFVSDAKDRLFETMAIPVLNRSLFAPYGQARELHLNSTEKTAEILFDLKGERAPVRVVIGRYELSQIDGETFVTLHAMETSREWMTEAVRRNVVGQPVKLPSEFAGLLSRLV